MSSARRSGRFGEMTYASHLRHKLTQRARERSGPAPQQIRWRGGLLDLDGAEEIRIGSDPENDIVLGEQGVEARHCGLFFRDGDWYLEDRSTGGTLANGGLVDGYFRLSAGDLIRVGRAVLRVR
jgi:pSer/pThr/pTyr-binding forkhead associated (FHA) protein